MKPDRDASFAATLRQLLTELPKLIGDRVHLLGLEMERAKSAMARIVAFTLAAAVFGATAWLALWGLIISGLMAAGLLPLTALLLTTLANALIAWLAVLQVRRLMPMLSLPATRRHLAFGVGTGRERDDEDALRAVDAHPLNPPPEQQIPQRP